MMQDDVFGQAGGFWQRQSDGAPEHCTQELQPNVPAVVLLPAWAAKASLKPAYCNDAVRAVQSRLLVQCRPVVQLLRQAICGTADSTTTHLDSASECPGVEKNDISKSNASAADQFPC